MRELAQRGGEATKKRASTDPGYYCAIGRMGGLASAIARREKSGASPAIVAPPPTDEQPSAQQAPPALEAVTEAEPLGEHLGLSDEMLCELRAFRTHERELPTVMEIVRALGLED